MGVFDDNVFAIILKRFLYLFFVCVLEWSLLGVKKGWATPKLVSFSFKISDEYPHPFHMGEPLGDFSIFLWK